MRFERIEVSTVMMRWLVVLVLLWWMGSAQVSAQDISTLDVTAHTRAVVYKGPGHTFLQLSWLEPGVPATIVERNRVGNWLRVQRAREDGTLLVDGWVMSAYMNLHPDLSFADVPTNVATADADPSTVQYVSVAALYEAPIIPEISDAMREVYARGQKLGNVRKNITKVGDSLSADPLYLGLMSQFQRELGAYDYLEETIAYFGPSTAVDSVAARVGMTSLVIFDPMWADPEQCNAGETPLTCEYRLKQPSISLMMFGANDVKHMTDAEFDVQVRMMVDQTLERGIIPVLSTFSYSPHADLWWQSVNFNQRLIDIADEYDVPLINLFAAAQPLPNYGLDIDQVHMKHSGFDYLKFDTGHDAWYGVSLRNLLSIRMLDELRLTLEMN
jgi:hypothetical protein